MRVDSEEWRVGSLNSQLALILALATTLFAQNATPSRGQLAACSGVKQCLNFDLPDCSEEEKKPNPDIKYNAEFCAPYKELRQRGLRTDDPKARDLYRYMGRQYRVIFRVKGTLPVSKETMMYLFDNMEFTAQLVNAYRKTKYTIKYNTKDKKNFSGDNGDKLQGRFVWLLNDSAGVNQGMHHVFFGWGKTKILAWNLQGTGTAILDLRSVGKDSVAYEFRTIVSPSGPVLNSIMNLGVFSNMVNGIIKEIIDNIEKAASEFSKGNRKPIENYAPFKDEKWKKNLQEFDEVTKGKQKAI